jgi:ABC-type branched-subunit amino acid transport system permease subunit
MSRSAVLGASLLALARFGPSRLGRAVLALRDDDVRAEALGFPTYRLKLVVFVVAGALGGVAGRSPSTCRATSVRTCCTGRSRAR